MNKSKQRLNALVNVLTLSLHVQVNILPISTIWQQLIRCFSGLQVNFNFMTRRVRWSSKCLEKGCGNTNLTPGVQLFPVPKPWVSPVRCMRWLRIVGREDMGASCIGKNSYVCGIHWSNGLGPTAEEPHPQFIQNDERGVLYSCARYFLVLQMNVCQLTFVWFSRPIGFRSQLWSQPQSL